MSWFAFFVNFYTESGEIFCQNCRDNLAKKYIFYSQVLSTQWLILHTTLSFKNSNSWFLIQIHEVEIWSAKCQFLAWYATIPGLSATREQCWSSQARTVLHISSMLAVDTKLLYESNRGRMMMLNCCHLSRSNSYTNKNMNNLLHQLIETFHTKFNLLILSIIITLSVTYAYKIKHLLRFSIYQVLLEIITEIKRLYNRLYKC